MTSVLIDLHTDLEDLPASPAANSSRNIYGHSAVGGTAAASSLPLVQQINYYAWDRSSKASKLAARARVGPGFAHPKRDRRGRDYLTHQLFGDSDQESGPDAAEPSLPRSSAPAQSNSGSGGGTRLGEEKLAADSAKPSSQTPPTSHQSSGIRPRLRRKLNSTVKSSSSSWGYENFGQTCCPFIKKIILKC
jgi:hypothetical protein